MSFSVHVLACLEIVYIRVYSLCMMYAVCSLSAAFDRSELLLGVHDETSGRFLARRGFDQNFGILLHVCRHCYIAVIIAHHRLPTYC